MVTRTIPVPSTSDLFSSEKFAGAPKKNIVENVFSTFHSHPLNSFNNQNKANNTHKRRRRMASEEERAKIMAEYLASTNNDDYEEEEEAVYSEDEDGDDAYDYEEENSNYPILQGRLKLDDGKNMNGSSSSPSSPSAATASSPLLVYLGTWCMKNDQQQQQQQNKTKTKFKLKSKTPPNFSLSKLPKESFTLHDMNGYFTTADDGSGGGGRKIKERGVQITFHYQPKDGNYQIQGKGSNEFGPFALEGLYTPPQNTNNETKYWLQCKKIYSTAMATRLMMMMMMM